MKTSALVDNRTMSYLKIQKLSTVYCLNSKGNCQMDTHALNSKRKPKTVTILHYMYVKFDTSLKDNIIMIVKAVKGNISYGSCSFIISAGNI